MNRFTETVTLTEFQRQVLQALASGAVLYAKPDGSVAYLSSQATQRSGYRCLRVIPKEDFYCLASIYIQPGQTAPGTGVKVYNLTAAGWRAAR